MPTYQYACNDCGHGFEAVQSFADDSLTTCPQCQGRLRKVFTSVGVVFKGSGFYRNDSRTSDSAAAGKKDPAGSSTASEAETAASSSTSGSSAPASDQGSASGTSSNGDGAKGGSTPTPAAAPSGSTPAASGSSA